ncbi:hypothetical protein LDENG_00149080 [Lucifuga dentata]|nr:hypothetical protein LDENG_00149080 [Lucifuga dentata]
MHTNFLVSKARQGLYHLRQLTILKSFYTAVIKSILTGSITAWFGNCTVQDWKALQCVVRSAERTIRSSLPALKDIYSKRCLTRTLSIKKDSTHPDTNCSGC